EGIVAVALIDLQRQGRLSMTGIDADHGQTKRSEFVPKPGRGRTSLEADALHASSLCPEELGNQQRCRKHCAFRRDPTVAVDYTDRRLFKRHVQSNIEFHSCSPDRSSPNLAQARLHKITESQSHIDRAYQAPSYAICENVGSGRQRATRESNVRCWRFIHVLAPSFSNQSCARTTRTTVFAQPRP